MSKIETKLLHWKADPGDFKGDIGVSTRLSGEHWRELEAQFHERDDGQGETPLLAVGSVQTSIGEVEFGVLDYRENETYLLVPASGGERRRLTLAVAEGLQEAGALSIDKDLEEEESSYQGNEKLLERVNALEQFAGEYLTNATLSVVPIATEITFPVQIGPERQRAGVDAKELVEPSVGHLGTVKFIGDKDWALISPEDGSEDVKVGLSDVDFAIDTLDEGTKVSFRYSVAKADEEIEKLGKDVEEATDPDSVYFGKVVKRYNKGGARTGKARRRGRRQLKGRPQ